MLLLSFADFFPNYCFRNKTFRNIIRELNGLDPDQDLHFVSHDHDLGPNHCEGYEKMTKGES